MIDIITAADHAARQSDRWLFLASLFVMGVFAIAVARFFVKQYLRLVEDHRKDRENYHGSLLTLTTDSNETAKTLAVSIDRNTDALRDCAESVKICRERSGQFQIK